MRGGGVPAKMKWFVDYAGKAGSTHTALAHGLHGGVKERGGGAVGVQVDHLPAVCVYVREIDR